MIKPVLAATEPLSEIYTPGESLGGSSATFATLLNPLISNFLIISGVVSFAIIIFAGFKFISAGGDKAKIEQATTILNFALLGLVLVVAAFLLTNIFGGLVGFGNFFKPN